MTIQKITPFLWFTSKGEEAINFYVSLFKNSKITSITRAPKGVPHMTEGALLTGTFVLDRVELMAIDGGPTFQFTEAISLMIHCGDQAEVDHFWNKLVAGGGQHSQCGWLKDRFGLSWQVIPRRLPELMADKDKAKAGRVLQAMLQMTKIDIAKLEAAANG